MAKYNRTDFRNSLDRVVDDVCYKLEKLCDEKQLEDFSWFVIMEAASRRIMAQYHENPQLLNHPRKHTSQIQTVERLIAYSTGRAWDAAGK